MGEAVNCSGENVKILCYRHGAIHVVVGNPTHTLYGVLLSDTTGCGFSVLFVAFRLVL